MPRILTRMRIDEVSAVDKGAGHGVKIMLMKRDDNNKTKHEDRPMSRFFDFFKRKSDNEHVKKAVDALAESVGNIVGEVDDDRAKALNDTLEQFQDYLEKNVSLSSADRSVDDNSQESDMLKKMAEALGLKIEQDAKDEDIAKAVATAFAARDSEIEVLKAEFTPEERKHYDALPEEKKADFRKADHAARKAEINKDTDLPEDVKKRLAKADENEKRLAALEEKNEVAEITKRVTEAGLPETEVVNYRKLFKADPQAAESLLKQAAAGWTAAKAAGAFKEVGGTGAGVAGVTAYDEFVAKAAELRKADPKLTPAQAFAKVYADPANAELAERERNESRPPVIAPPTK